MSQSYNFNNVTVFSQINCAYCVSAKNLLTQKGIPFVERNLTTDAGAKADLMSVAPGARTVPQVVIDGKLIGGFDMLVKYLNRS